MKPIYEIVEEQEASSIKVTALSLNEYEFIWHHHHHLELTLTEDFYGNRYVGDNIFEINGTDLVLLGNDLPHTWYSPAPEDAPPCHVISIKIDHDLPVFDPGLKEFSSINHLLNDTDRGIHFSEKQTERVRPMLHELCQAKPSKRLLLLLEILEILSSDPGKKYISSESYSNRSSLKNPERMDRVLSYINDHYHAKITLKAVANVAGMSPNSFSRYFKKSTTKTLIEYIISLRIGEATKLLRETDKNITEIAFETGFSNLSNFNRKFLKIHQCSPREYRKEFAF